MSDATTEYAQLVLEKMRLEQRLMEIQQELESAGNVELPVSIGHLIDDKQETDNTV